MGTVEGVRVGLVVPECEENLGEGWKGSLGIVVPAAAWGESVPLLSSFGTLSIDEADADSESEDKSRAK